MKPPITITSMTRLVVTRGTSGWSNAPLMSITTGLLLTHDVSENPPTLLVAVLVVMEAVFTMWMVTFTVRTELDTNLVIAFELPVHFVRFPAMVMVFRVGHNSLESYESTLSGDKQLDRRAAVLARAVLETEGAAGV